MFFIVWALLAFMLLGKTSPHVISFSFVGTIVPAVALFFCTPRPTPSAKKLFLILTYANIFCIILCLSVLLCDSLLPGLSRVGQIYARSIVRIALTVPAILLYLRYARPYMRTVPGDKKRTWYSISLVSALFLFVFSLLVALIMRNTRDTVYSMLFGTTTVIFRCRSLGHIRHDPIHERRGADGADQPKCAIPAGAACHRAGKCHGSQGHAP